MFRIIQTAALLIVVSFSGLSNATRTAESLVRAPGSIKAVVAAGPVVIDREVTWGLETSFEIGVTPVLELAAPLALGIRLMQAKPNSGLILGIGFVDMCITAEPEWLVVPSISLAGQARLGPEVALFGAIDVSGVEAMTDWVIPPLWSRGAVAFSVDLGPWVTLAAGFSFQRALRDTEPPKHTDKTGWFGNARFSLGAVRAKPFTNTPTLSVHVLDWLDVVALIRVSIDTDTRTTRSSWLLGFEFHR
jgi:hypothetical protein